MQTRTRVPMQKISDGRMRRFCNCYEGRGDDSEEYRDSARNPQASHHGYMGGSVVGGYLLDKPGMRNPKRSAFLKYNRNDD